MVMIENNRKEENKKSLVREFCEDFVFLASKLGKIFLILVLLLLPFSCIGNEMWYLNRLKIGILSQQSKIHPPSRPKNKPTSTILPLCSCRVRDSERRVHIPLA